MSDDPSAAELLAALRTFAGELRALVESVPGSALDRSEDEGWSARAVLAHLADFELMAAVRVRTVLSRERPVLANYGQEEFTDRFSGLEDAADALERIEVNRRSTLKVLEALAPEDWERVGVHPSRGDETLRRTVTMLVRHDRGHLDQLRAAAGTP